MYIKTLKLKNFRVFGSREFYFEEGVNLITGANAQGKSSILEAIHILMTGKSFRTPRLQDMIRTGESSFLIEAHFVKHGIKQTISFATDGKNKKILHNQNPCQITTGLIGLIQGVVMVPDDVSLVKAGPRLRRRYLDIQLVQIDPLYVHHLTRYYRAMDQRNHLLRGKDLTTIRVWEQELAKSGAYVVGVRQKAALELDQEAAIALSQLSNDSETLTLSYQTKVPAVLQEAEDFLVKKYDSYRERELLYGNTLVGPHKEDLQVQINSKEVRYFASEGQQRSVVIALRFAEWNRLHRLASDAPIMMIDDVGMSLDKKRHQCVLDLMHKFQQVFLTSTDRESDSKTAHICAL